LKKTILIFIVILLAILYYLGAFTHRETLPLSKDFFSIGASIPKEQILDPKEMGWMKSRSSEQKSFSLTQKELEQIYQMKLDKGVKNLTAVSLYLVRESKQARNKGNLERAAELVTYADKLSPDLPDPCFELAWIRWRQNPLRLHEVFSEILKGQLRRFHSYPGVLSFFYHIFYILSNAILTAFIIYGIVILVKYISLYFYDIRKNLTQELRSLLINGVKIFVLFIPFFLRLDILWAILFWSILLWGYVPNRERQLILVFLIVLTYLPFFLRTSSSFLNSEGPEIILEMDEANHGNWDKGTEERLKAWLLTHPDDPEVLFTLGLMEKRQGHYAQAQEYYRRTIDHHPRFSKAFSNLGNVYLAQKQVPLAITSYQQAIELDPGNAAYHYNLYRAYSQETFLSGKIDKAFQKARQIDPGLVDYYSLIDSPNMNRLVIDVPLSIQTLWRRFLNQLIGKEGILYRLFRAWFDKVPSAIPFLAPIVFLAYLIGMSRYTRAKRFLTRCPMCGSPTYRFYLGSTEQEFVCFNCYRLFIQKEKLHPKIMEKKSIQAKAFQKQDHFIGKFLSFIFIGFGDLWRGHPLKGLLLLSVFFIFILRFIFWNGLIPDITLERFSSWWSLLFWGGFFLLFYFLCFRQIQKQKPQFEIEK